MSSKLEYLKRYQDKDKSSNKKRKKRDNNSTNFTIIDDNAKWTSSSTYKRSESHHLGEEPEDAPIVTEVCDHSVVRWKSFSAAQSVEDSADMSPPRQKRSSNIDAG